MYGKVTLTSRLETGSVVIATRRIRVHGRTMRKVVPARSQRAAFAYSGGLSGLQLDTPALSHSTNSAVHPPKRCVFSNASWNLTRRCGCASTQMHKMAKRKA